MYAIRSYYGNLRKLHFLLFPEACLPFAYIDEMLAFIDARFRTNTVTIFGVEHVELRTYLALLRRYAADNGEALARVEEDMASGDIESVITSYSIHYTKLYEG